MLDRITASLPSLAPAEQRVAKLVLTDPRTFARLPGRELAGREQTGRGAMDARCMGVTSWCDLTVTRFR